MPALKKKTRSAAEAKLDNAHAAAWQESEKCDCGGDVFWKKGNLLKCVGCGQLYSFYATLKIERGTKMKVTRP